MRLAKLLFSLVLLNALSVHAQDNPVLATRLIEAGAPELVLKQAQALGGLPNADPAWRDVVWEAAALAGKRIGLEPPPSPEASPAALPPSPGCCLVRMVMLS